MILNQLIFDVKLINEENGDVLNYISPQQITGLKMKKVINGISNLVITFLFNQSIWDNYGIDRLIEVSTINHSTNLLEKEDTFFLRKREIYFEENIKQMSFTCVGLVDLLARRVMIPTPTDNTSGGGFVTRAGVAGFVMGELVKEQIIDPSDVTRKFSNVTYSKVDNGNIVGMRTRYTSLLDVFDQLRVNGDVDYRVERISDNDLQIQVGNLGTDKTYANNYLSGVHLVFSPLLGNIIDPYFFEDSQRTNNSIYVLGEGEGVNQKVLSISGSDISNSIYNKREVSVSSRKGERSLGSANQQALTTGLKKLVEDRQQDGFEFEIIENRLGFRYRVDWDIGDFVTFYWENKTLDFQIKGTTFTVNGNQISRTVELDLQES